MAVPRIENAVALHIILVAAVGLGLFVSRRMIDPARLLVPCNDNSISLPLKQETVTTAHIIAYICLIPPLIILITEFLRWHLDDEEWLPVKQMTLFSLWVPKLVQSLYICIGNFLYGAALTMMTVELGKKIAGRLRPHFIDACKPTNLVQFCEASRTQQYTVDLICSNKRGEINARESFPSAHAAASFYIAVYLLTYLQLRMSWKSVIVPVMRPMMQFAFIQVAFVIALTRVRDHYHFYSDVAAGAILGILCAFITYFEKIFYLKQLGQTKGFLKTILPLTSIQFALLISQWCFYVLFTSKLLQAMIVGAIFYMSPLPRRPKSMLVYSPASSSFSPSKKDASTSTTNIIIDIAAVVAATSAEGVSSRTNDELVTSQRSNVEPSSCTGKHNDKHTLDEVRGEKDIGSRFGRVGVKSTSVIMESGRTQ